MSSLQVDNIQTYNSNPPVIKNASGTQIGTFCRAWVNFNGTGTVAIRASFNVSSITDNGTGDYTVNFATAMPDANYSPVADCNWDNGSQNLTTTWRDLSTSGGRVRTVYGINSTNYDAVGVFVAIFR
jgi:hypothetical protein